jgi:hypothetical protein
VHASVTRELAEIVHGLQGLGQLVAKCGTRLTTDARLLAEAEVRVRAEQEASFYLEKILDGSSIKIDNSIASLEPVLENILLTLGQVRCEQHCAQQVQQILNNKQVLCTVQPLTKLSR